MTILYSVSFAIAFLIVVGYIGFFKEKDIWFLMTFLSLTVCNAGYLTLALSRTLEEALLANRLAYLGSIFLPFFLLITIMKVCKFHYHRSVPFVLTFLNVIMLLITVSGGYSDIYYKKVAFQMQNGIGSLVKEYGSFHALYYVFLLAYFGMMIAVIIRSFFRRKDVSYKHALCLAVAVFLNIALYFTEKAVKLEFECLSFSYIIASVFLLVIYRAMDNYNVDKIMKNTMETDSTGVILFDENLNFKGCNEDAVRVFPDLSVLKLEYPVPQKAKTLQSTVVPILTQDQASQNMTCKRDGKIYRLSAKPFYKTGISGSKKLGTAVIVSDDTAQQEYLQLISSYNTKLQAEVAEKTRHVIEMHDNLIFGMADMVESRDPNTGGHIKRTSAVVEIFSEKLLQIKPDNLSDTFISNVVKAAPMHDLGKITIEDAILRKPGKFDQREYEIMKTHAVRGAEIVGKVLCRSDDEEFYRIAGNVAHYHHEKYDGSGYPDGLKGKQIPAEARIMALADVFDALVSKRCYKNKYSYDEAFQIVSDSLGSHFDPQLGKLFLSCSEELIAYYEKASRQENAYA